MSDRTPPSLKLYKRFVDDGWAGWLKPTESIAWLIMWRFADNETCECYPSARTIAKGLGHGSPARSRAIRGRLAELGLLVEVRPGGGKQTAVYRLAVPEGTPATKSVAAPATESVAAPRYQIGSGGATKSVAAPATESVAAPATKSVAQNYSLNIPKNHPPQQPRHPAAGAAAASSLGEQQATGLDATVRDVMRRDYGVNRQGLDKVGRECPGMTLEVAGHLWRKTGGDPSVKSRAGLFITLACQDGPELVAAQAERRKAEEIARAAESERAKVEAAERASRLAELVAESVAKYEADEAGDYLTDADAIRARHGDIMLELARLRLEDADLVARWPHFDVKANVPYEAGTVLAVEEYRAGRDTLGMGRGRQLNPHSPEYRAAEVAARKAKEEADRLADEAADLIISSVADHGGRAVAAHDHWEIHGPDGTITRANSDFADIFAMHLDSGKAWADAIAATREEVPDWRPAASSN